MSFLSKNEPLAQDDRSGNPAQTGPTPLPGDPIAQSIAFLTAAFGDPEKAWVCCFPNILSADWTGGFGTDQLRAEQAWHADRYVCAALLDPAATARGNKSVMQHRLIVLDDIGSKVDPARLKALFAAGLPRPMAVLETSPKNYQIFWRLKDPVPVSDTDGCADVAHLRGLLASEGLTDPKSVHAAHYFRLGGGWNSKEERVKANGGTPPPVTYAELDVTRSVTVEELGMGFFGSAWRTMVVDPKIAAAAVAAAGGGGAGGTGEVADLSKPGLNLIMAQELGLILGQRGGKVDAICPNVAAHTPDGREETGFCFLSDREMACQHGHCAGLTSVDFARMLRQQFDEEMAARAAQGMAVIADDADALNARLAAAAFAASPIEQAQLVLLAGGVAASAPGGGEGAGKRPKLPVHVQARDLLTREGITPFLDDLGNAWLTLNGWHRSLRTPAGARALTGWLAERGIDVTGQARGHLTELLEAIADQHPRQTVYFRAANHGPVDDPAIFVNLMDREGRAVRIDGAGWQIVKVKDLPVPMAHREGGLLMPEPVRATDGISFVSRLERHIPLGPVLRADDPRDEGVRQRAVLLTFLAAQFIRTGTVPHLALMGEQGGGKTTTARRLNALTDPDAAAVLSRLPGDEASFYSMVRPLSNFILDNASTVRADQADTLCALSTGAASSRRALYTDGERSMARALVSTIFTSVADSLTKRPDLQDRMLTLQTRRLPEGKRRGEGELNAAWEADMPFLLGGLFDLLACGLAGVNEVREAQRLGRLPPPPRFADVGQAAEAAAWRGMGWPAGLLTQALTGLRQDVASDQLEDDPIAYRVRDLLQTSPGRHWRGTFAELERALRFREGPMWPPGLPLKQGLARVAGPMFSHWAIETTPARWKDARGREFRLHGENQKGA